MHLISGFLLISLLSLAISWQPNSRVLIRSSPMTLARPSALFSTTPAVPPPPTAPSDENSAAETEWTKPRLHNSAAFRSAAILGALALASQSPVQPSAAVSAYVHVLAFGTWFGTVAYTTFVAGITMFKNLPRKTFGKLQAKLFPKYFMLSSATLVLQLVTVRSLSIYSKKAVTALAVALAMTVLNQFVLEPISSNNMMERYNLEDAGDTGTDRYKKLKADFGKFHGMSSLTNLIAMCAGVVHAVYLASALVV
jgi:hypothetical protein